MAEPTPPESAAVQSYPGGEDYWAYKLAFTVWVVVFLAVICAGLLDYLGTYAQHIWPSL